MTKKYKDPNPKVYTFEEKLAAVNAGLMAPEDLGVLPTPGDASEATAGGVEIKPLSQEELRKKPELGGYVVFQAAVVPLKLRATWAEMDWAAKEKPQIVDKGGETVVTFDQDAWIEEHKDEHLIQAKFQCGTAAGAIEGKFTDKILGLTNLLNAAATQIKEFYENEKKTETSK